MPTWYTYRMATGFYTKDRHPTREETERQIAQLKSLLEGEHQLEHSAAAQSKGDSRATAPVHFDFQANPSKVVISNLDALSSEDTPTYVPPRPTNRDKEVYGNSFSLWEPASGNNRDEGQPTLPQPARSTQATTASGPTHDSQGRFERIFPAL